MRVVSRARRDERGAVAVIVAICAVMFFGFAAYAIDSGNAWQTRRQHGDWLRRCGAGGRRRVRPRHDRLRGVRVADDYLDRNVDDASLVDVRPARRGRRRRLRHGRRVRRRRSTRSPRIFGIEQTSPRSAVDHDRRVGHAQGRQRLAPVRPSASIADSEPRSLCSSGCNLPERPEQARPARSRSPTRKPKATACGGNVPGNWGIMDFDGRRRTRPATSRLDPRRLQGEYQVTDGYCRAARAAIQSRSADRQRAPSSQCARTRGRTGTYVPVADLPTRDGQRATPPSSTSSPSCS